MTRQSWPLTVLVLSLLLSGCAVTSSPFDRSGSTSGTESTPLVGTTWLLEELNNQPAIADSYPSAIFSAEGTVSGSAGCNSYSGQYATEGTHLRVVGGLASTMMACDDPIMAQETVFFEALKNTVSFSLTDDTLRLADSEGTPVAVFTAQSQDLADTSWQITAFNNGQQAVVSVLDGTSPSLEFSADGQVSGTSGCNRIIGSFTTSQDDITFGALGTTQMLCSDPEGVMEQEQQLIAALGTAATYHIEGAVLQMRTSDDAIAVQFTKA